MRLTAVCAQALDQKIAEIGAPIRSIVRLAAVRTLALDQKIAEIGAPIRSIVR